MDGEAAGLRPFPQFLAAAAREAGLSVTHYEPVRYELTPFGVKLLVPAMIGVRLGGRSEVVLAFLLAFDVHAIDPGERAALQRSLTVSPELWYKDMITVLFPGWQLDSEETP